MNEEKKYHESFWGAPTKECCGSVFYTIIVLIFIAGSFFVRIPNQQISLIVTQSLIVLPAFIYMLAMKQNPFKFIRFRKFHFGSAFLVILFMICCLPVMWFLNAISMLFATPAIDQSTVEDLTGGSVWIGLLLMAALPAFVEEVTFRGAIYHSLRGARPVRAIILSGIMFGLMHMNLNQFVYAAGLGIVMAFLLEATGSIISTMMVHFCFNSFSVIMISLFPKLQAWATDYYTKMGMSKEQMDAMFNTSVTVGPKEVAAMLAVLLPMAVLGGALAFLLYIAIAKLNKRWNYIRFLFAKQTKPQRDAFPNPRFIYIWTYVGLGIAFAMCVLSEIATHLMNK